MLIKSIELNGYKRFHHLTIDLGDNPSRIVALVGPNGCGKSSVFDGLLFLHNNYHLLGSTGAKDAAYHSLYQEHHYAYENVQVRFSEGPYSAVYQTRSDAGKESTIFSFRSPYRYNSAVKIQETRAIDEIRLNNYGASTTNDIDAKMEVSYRRLLARYSRHRDENDIKPSEARNYVIGQLNSSLRNCLDLEIAYLGDVETGQGTIYFKKPDQARPFEFNVLSSGEKEVVDIVLDIYLRQFDYDDTVFIIDEPELHINTAIQRRLLVEINNLVGLNCQILIATHSPGFLSAIQDDLADDCQIIYFDPEKDFGASRHTLLPMSRTPQNWGRIFATALDDIADLVVPKRLVYCEGRAEPVNRTELGVDAQAYNNIFGGSHGDTMFVSSGGNTEPQQRSDIAISILQKVVTGLEILVLLDRDFASGAPTDANDRAVYLKTNPDHHRVLNRRELENYLYDEEVLQKYCSDNNLTFDADGYKKHVTNISDDNVKDKTGIIKNLCGIVSQINADTFKLELSKTVTTDMRVYGELSACIFDIT